MDVEYKYSGLDSAHREIRLLHLLPGSWEEPLRCHLQIVSLDDQPVYQGLSYVWGQPEITKTIQLEGKPFEVAVNLWTALRRLRSPHRERIIWADAACINQKDLEERSHQVALMGEIYSSASKVFIWLGDSISDDSDPLLQPSPGTLEDGRDINWFCENIERIFKRSALPDHESEALAALGTLYLLSVDEHWTDKPLFVADHGGQYHIVKDYLVAWKATLKLLQLPWWSRLWVVQELALAKRATVVLGSVSAPWDLISDFCHSYLKHLPPGACCHSSATWKMSSDLWDNIVLMRLTVWSFHTSRTDMLQPRSKHPHNALWEYLWLLRHKEATDPRDKVYGLLGLLHSHQDPFLAPDYSMSIAETFSRCTEALIKSDNSLNALIGPRLRQSGLPTWVIDLLPKENSGNVLFFQNLFKRISSTVVFNACRTQSLRFSIKLTKLSLYGIRIDRVKHTAMAWDEGLVAQRFREWEELSCVVSGEIEDSSSSSVYPNGSTRKDAFWRTMVRDTIRDYQNGEKTRRANSADEQSYLVFRRWLLNGQHQTASSNENNDDNNTDDEMASANFANFRKSFFIATQHQRLFTTTKTYIGLGDFPQPNDEIWVLFGGKVPFLLRPYHYYNADNDGDNEDDGDPDHAVGCYALVSDCYVHGVMDGEAMEEEGWKERDEAREVVLV